jgi:AraC family transcriptional regulator
MKAVISLRPDDGPPDREDSIDCTAHPPIADAGAYNTPNASRVCPLPAWRLQRVDCFITAHLAGPVSLADLAGATGLSRMHFAAQFRAATGRRPHEYLLGRRIEVAKALLADQDRPLVEIALSVGFQEQSHFSTVFKRHTGTSPAAWRRLARRG